MKNPYANADGSPMEGKLSLFLAWEEEQSEKRKQKLTPAKRKELEESIDALNDRMKS